MTSSRPSVGLHWRPSRPGRARVMNVAFLSVLVGGLGVLWAPPALASVSILGTSASGTANDGASSSITIANFTVGSADDRLLVVSTGAAGNVGADVTGVTFGGTVALTQAIDQDGEFGATAEIWYLKFGSGVSPITGNVVVTYDRVVFAYAVATAFQGVDQGATPVQATGNQSTDITVPSQSGSLALDAIMQSASDDGSLTVGAEQTQEGNFNLGFGGNFDGGQSTEPGAPNVDMSWTSMGSSTVFAHAAINIVAAAPANSPPVATDDTATAVNGIPVDINVLFNDSDPNGDTLSVIGVTQGTNGSVTNNGDGTVTYDPVCFQGTDSFTYTIDDGNSGSDVGMVTVKVRKTSRRGSAPCQ